MTVVAGFACTCKAFNRGGASEASVATLTGDVDGSSRYMYHTRVKPLGQLLHAHAQMALSQQFLKFIFTRKGNSGKKDLLLRSGLEPGSDALQTTAFATEPMGLWAANLALILLTAAVSVDYSERPWPSWISGEGKQTQALQGILTALF